MSEEYKVSVAELAKKLELIPVIPEINTNDIYITQAEVNRPALQLAGADYWKCRIYIYQ